MPTVMPPRRARKLSERAHARGAGRGAPASEREGSGGAKPPGSKDDRAALLQGTLDMLILRTLLFGPAHGHGIARHIQRTTDEVLKLEHGSLYPALHRLLGRGWIVAKWETLPPVRECRYYRLTPLAGNSWRAKSRGGTSAKAIASVMTSEGRHDSA